jgi:ABC-type cobalamin transport system ATPase subunit
VQAINAVMARCDAEAKGIAGTALVVLLIGPAGVGKSLLLDAMTCMWPDSAYTTPPDGWQPVSMVSA